MELYQGSIGLDLKGLSAGLHGFTSLERFSLLYSGSAVDIYIYTYIRVAYWLSQGSSQSYKVEVYVVRSSTGQWLHAEGAGKGLRQGRVMVLGGG